VEGRKEKKKKMKAPMIKTFTGSQLVFFIHRNEKKRKKKKKRKKVMEKREKKFTW